MMIQTGEVTNKLLNLIINYIVYLCVHAHARVCLHILINDYCELKQQDETIENVTRTN